MFPLTCGSGGSFAHRGPPFLPIMLTFRAAEDVVGVTPFKIDEDTLIGSAVFFGSFFLPRLLLMGFSFVVGSSNGDDGFEV